MLMQEQSEALLDVVLGQLPCLYSVDLRGQGLGPACAARLAAGIDALRDAPYRRLTLLHLCNNRFGAAGVARIADAALVASGDAGNASGARMRNLDLAWNRAGPEGGIGVAKALECARVPLVELDLECNDICDGGAIALSAALPRALDLRILRLGGNRIGAVGGQAIGEALPRTHIATLVLDRNYLGPRGATAVANALRETCTLQVLSLAMNRAGDVGALAFVEAFQARGRPTTSARDHANPDSLGLSGNFITDQGAQAFASIVGSDSLCLRYLDLRYNKLTNLGVEALANAASTGGNLTLQKIDFVGNEEVSCVSIARVEAALRRNCRSIIVYDPWEAGLELCKAGGYRLDLTNLAAGLTGARRLAETLLGPRIRVRELALSNVGLGDSGTIMLAESLQQQRTQAKQFGRNRTLDELDLSWNRIGAGGAEALAALLSVSPGSLDLDTQEAPVQAAVINGGPPLLVSAVGCGVVSLDLRCNNLGDSGVRAIAFALSATNHFLDYEPRSDESPTSHSVCWSCLRVLRLASNGIGPQGAAYVAKVVRGSAFLEELDLGCNRIGPSGAASLGDALRESGLQLLLLDLTVNRIYDAGAVALADAIRSQQRLNAPSDHNETSKGLTLRLGSNFIGDEGAVALADALTINRTLARLGLENNKLGGRGAEALATAVRKRKQLSVGQREGGCLPVVEIAGNFSDVHVHFEKMLVELDHATQDTAASLPPAKRPRQ